MISPFDLPPDLQAKVEEELEAGERIQWLGMPTPRFFTPAATGAFLFAIPWTAFALFWTAGAAWGAWHVGKGNGPGLFCVFPLFGLPFILIGIGMLSSPLWAHWRARKTAYMITDRRAVTFDGGWSTTIRSYPPAKLQDVYRREKKDGSGHVIISRRAWSDSKGDNRSEELGFLRIANPKEVEDMLKQLAEQAETRQVGTPPEGSG
ncbi:MAG: PH domain-containing protein [Thermoguttaceae bacterium]